MSIQSIAQLSTRRQIALIEAPRGYLPGDTFAVRYSSGKIVECTLLYTYSAEKARVSYNRHGAEFHADVTSAMLAVQS